jgi:hypothetical protein
VPKSELHICHAKTVRKSSYSSLLLSCLLGLMRDMNGCVIIRAATTTDTSMWMIGMVCAGMGYLFAGPVMLELLRQLGPVMHTHKAHGLIIALDKQHRRCRGAQGSNNLKKPKADAGHGADGGIGKTTNEASSDNNRRGSHDHDDATLSSSQNGADPSGAVTGAGDIIDSEETARDGRTEPSSDNNRGGSHDDQSEALSSPTFVTWTSKYCTAMP